MTQKICTTPLTQKICVSSKKTNINFHPVFSIVCNANGKKYSSFFTPYPIPFALPVLPFACTEHTDFVKACL